MQVLGVCIFILGMSDQMFGMGSNSVFGSSSSLPDFGHFGTSSTNGSLTLSTSSIMSQTLMKQELLKSHTNMLVGTSSNTFLNSSSDSNNNNKSHPLAAMSATALLQKAAQMGSTRTTTNSTTLPSISTSSRTTNITLNSLRPDTSRNSPTRDFLGIRNVNTPFSLPNDLAKLAGFNHHQFTTNH